MYEHYVGVILVFMVSVIVHEAGHTLTALALGYKLKKFYIGIPFDEKIGEIRITTNILRKQIGGVEIGFSALLLGGAVDFHDFEAPPFRKFFLIVAYGPLSSLLLGFVPLLFFYDLKTAIDISTIIIDVVFASLWQVISGGIGLGGIAGPVTATHQMVGFATQYSNGYVLLLVVLNLAFFATNILPIPAIDGGHLLFSVIEKIFGHKAKLPLAMITKVFWYLLMVLMMLVMTKDFW